MSTARQKKGIFGQHPAKAGQLRCGGPDAGPRNRCYEPAVVQPAVPIPGQEVSQPPTRTFDHDFVIGLS
jgi:hypothetical protein